MKRILCLLFAALAFAATPTSAADISLSPGIIHVFGLLGAKDGPKNALVAIQAYVTAHPADGNGFAARCFLRFGLAPNGADIAPILADCRKGVVLSPTSTFAHMELADTLFQTNHPNKALAEYTQAINLGLTAQGIFWKRCDTLRALRKYAAAIIDCNRQVEITPQSYRTRITRGKLEVTRAAYSAAVGDFDAASKLKPSSPTPYLLKSSALTDLGDYSGSARALSQAIRLGSTSPYNYYARAMSRMKIGRKADARADLEIALNDFKAKHMTAQVAATTKEIASLNLSPQTLPTIRTSGPVVLFRIAFTSGDVSKLLHGLHAAYDEKDMSVHINYDVDPTQPRLTWNFVASQMRADGVPVITIALPSGTSTPPQDSRMDGAILLGLADSGYAGSKWQALYATMLARDKQLPATAPDPYLNRRALANALAALYERLTGTHPR